MSSLKGKTLFISGASRGIGLAIGKRAARDGANVAIAAKSDQPHPKLPGTIHTAAREIEEAGGKGLAMQVDIRDENAVAQAAKQCAEHFGGIDILVNNAAKHLLEYNRPVTELPREMWRRMLDVNLLGVVNCSASCRPYMRGRGGGVIVNQSSIAGFQSIGSYGITKLAVRGLTVALAHELAVDDIRVNGIAPGATESEAALAALPPERFQHFVDQQLIKRRGTMDDLVGPLLFLCSADAGFVTGETLIVGGGFPLRV